MKYNRIKDMREKFACTQKQIAEYLSVSVRTYRNYENCKTRVPAIAIIQLAIYYNTSMDYLIGLTDVVIPHERRTHLTSSRA